MSTPAWRIRNEARLAAIDLVTGLPDPTFAPTLDNPARGIDSTDDRVAVSYGGNNRFVVHDETGASVATWTGNGDFQAAPIVGDRAFVGSHSHLLGAYDRKQIAAVYLSDGSISLTFDTEVTGGVGVKAILASGSHLYLGGEVNSIGATWNDCCYGRIGPEAGEDVPATPTGLAGSSPADGVIDLSWQTVPDATRYRVLRSGEQWAVTSATGISDTTVQPGVEYEYHVEAIDAEYDLSPRSAGVRVLAAGGGGGGPVGSVLVVVGDAGAMSTGDLAIRNQLLATNYDVTVVSDEDATVAQADGHDAVFRDLELVVISCRVLPQCDHGGARDEQGVSIRRHRPRDGRVRDVVDIAGNDRRSGASAGGGTLWRGDNAHDIEIARVRVASSERGDRRRCHRYAGFVPLPTGGPSCRRYAGAELPSRVPGLEDIGRLAHSRGMAAVRRDVQRARRRM